MIVVHEPAREEVDAEERVLPAELQGVEGAGVVVPAQVADQAVVAVEELLPSGLHGYGKLLVVAERHEGLVNVQRAVPFGEGFIDYKAFFAGLRDGGFDGIATYEMCSPIRGGGSTENLDRYAQKYLRWMSENGAPPA